MSTKVDCKRLYKLLQETIKEMQFVLDNREVYEDNFSDLPNRLFHVLDKAEDNLNSLKEYINSEEVLDIVGVTNIVYGYVDYLKDVKHQLEIFGLYPEKKATKSI